MSVKCWGARAAVTAAARALLTAGCGRLPIAVARRTRLVSRFVSVSQTREGYRVLVLSRNVGETIEIGSTITVRVLAVVNGRKVRLGIEAPASVPITRGELVNATECQAHRSKQSRPYKSPPGRRRHA